VCGDNTKFSMSYGLKNPVFRNFESLPPAQYRNTSHRHRQYDSAKNSFLRKEWLT